MVFSNSHSPQTLAAALTVLQSIYGAPSQAGFGSAVFDEQIEPGKDLDAIARRYYQHFVGPLWEQYGEAAWMGAWKQVYSRPTGLQPDIVAELRAIDGPAAANYIPILLLDETDEQDRAQQALATVFNHPQVTDLRVYVIGDGAAMSGLLLAAYRANGAVTILLSLLD
jgi:hypothetical protein